MSNTIELLCDIVTKLNKKEYTYGKKGDKAKVISIHGDVLIVEIKERFSVHIDKTKKV